MSDELGEPVPESPAEDPDASADLPRARDLGWGDSPHSGYVLGAERPPRRQPAADPGAAARDDDEPDGATGGGAG